ncbi:MAG TPA: CPBP family intramembrane glutamic endopeptidase [Bryobacteraceae bacterium]|nr:CPBP family intramembrane glutamic endopeptidase [Bryobacteraceae bacterium]
MSSKFPVVTVSPARRFWSLFTVAFGTVVFFVIVGFASKVLRALVEGHVAGGLRTRATLTLSGSAAGECLVLVLLVLFLHFRSRSLRELGLWQPSPLRGWIVAGIFTALYVLMTLAALRGRAALNELSSFHLCNSLVAGLSAGFVEEIFFRGWVMGELKWSGLGPAVQVIASGILFGVAHVGWGLLTTNINWAVAFGSITATAVLGILYAIAYLVSRRSLMPVVVGHMTADILLEPWLVLAALSAARASHL